MKMQEANEAVESVADRPRAVLFDLDGTLVDSAPDLRTSVNILLVRHGLSPLAIGDVRNMIGNGLAALVARAFARRGRHVAGEELDGLQAAMLDIYAENLTTLTRAMPGAHAALGALAGAGVRLAVVTNKPQAAAERILDSLALLSPLAAVVGGAPGIEPKPHPDGLLKALAILGAESSDAVMVGDSAFDVEAGHRAGLPVVLVRNGYPTSPRQWAMADSVIEDLNQCANAVAALWRLARRSA